MSIVAHGSLNIEYYKQFANNLKIAQRASRGKKNAWTDTETEKNGEWNT